jgi:hypothetical protein
MRLYLSSFDIGDDPAEFVKLAPNGRVGIIMNALKRVAFDVIQDSHFGCGMIHCGSKENRDGQAATDGVA